MNPTDSRPDEPTVPGEPPPDETTSLHDAETVDPAQDVTVDAASETGRALRGRSECPTRIGNYPVVRELGRGGMGVVYVARDPRLEREVALKVLPESLARSAHSFARFQREARLLASLNHPNVATIYSLEDADGDHFLTMELIRGETLSERIDRSVLPLPELLDVGRQIAAAVEAAHRTGVIHRDLKPANIMVAPDGQVKVLDFGLAVALRPSARAGSGSAAAAGQEVAGTPGYMSPEQLRGAAVDQRADIWAFGCVLYECISGHRAIEGATVADRITSTLEREPDLDRLPGDAPARIRDLVANCLIKDVDQRLDTMIRARQEIEEEIAHRSRPSVSRTRDPGPNNLPASLTSFVGREEQKAEVAQLLNRSRLVTLAGFGGRGKTRLSIEVGRDLLETYFDGAWLVELAPLTDPELVPQVVGTTLGLKDEPGRPMIDTLVDFLTDKTLLMILDNCEHLVEAASQLTETILRSCADVRVLATSREALGVTGEFIYQVPSLSLPSGDAPLSLEELSAIEAVALFLVRATAVRNDFTLTTDNASAVVQICRRLDGIPLAIELAAARVKVISPQQIAERLDNRFQLLTSRDRTAMPHHQTLRALIDWSYDYLDLAEQSAFRRLSVFAGGWTLDAAEAVCSGENVDDWEVLDLHSQLIDKSLIEMDAEANPETGKTRYRMLESVREYARERLAERGEESAARLRHRDCFLRLAEEAEPKLIGSGQRTWLFRLVEDRGNLRRALDTCLADDGDIEIGLRIAAALGRYWLMRGHWREARGYYAKLFSRADPEQTTAARAGALNWSGNLALLRGDHTEARASLEKSVRIRRDLGDREGTAFSLNNLANVVRAEGQFDRAGELYEESLAIQRELDNPVGMTIPLNGLGLLAYLRKDLDAARAYHEECLAIRRRLEDPWLIASSLNNLGAVAEAAGDRDQAHRCYEEGLAIQRELGDRHAVAAALNNLAELAKAREDYDRACSYWEECLLLFREIGNRNGLAIALTNLGATYQKLEKFDQARALYCESLTVFWDLDDRHAIPAVIKGLGVLAAERGDLEQGVRFLGMASAAQRATDTPWDPHDEAELHRHAAALRSALGSEAFEAVWAPTQKLSVEEMTALVLESHPPASSR